MLIFNVQKRNGFLLFKCTATIWFNNVQVYRKEMVYCVGVQNYFLLRCTKFLLFRFTEWQRNGVLLRCTATIWYNFQVYSNDMAYCIGAQQRNGLMLRFTATNGLMFRFTTTNGLMLRCTATKWFIVQVYCNVMAYIV